MLTLNVVTAASAVATQAGAPPPAPVRAHMSHMEVEHETFAVMKRAGLVWQRQFIGAPTKTLADIAKLPLQRKGNRSVLDAVPTMQQELLRLTWYSVYACRQQYYHEIDSLVAAHVAPRGILRQLPHGQLGRNASMADLLALRASSNADAERCADFARVPGPREPAKREESTGDEYIGTDDDTFFFNASCRRFMDGMLRRAPPAAEWCQFQTAPSLYRLGDIVERPRQQEGGSAAKSLFRDFNDSIAADYLRTPNHGVNNHPLLRSILERRFAHVPPLEAALHIRAGDTIEEPGASAMQFLCDRNVFGRHSFSTPLLGAYVFSLCYYESIADELRNRSVRTVAIFAGNHNTQQGGMRKSCAYIRAIGEFFTSRNFHVIYKLNLTADESFAAASRARIFIPSGGGYSALIMKMSRVYGNTVVRGGCTPFAHDFEGFDDREREHGSAAMRASHHGFLLPVRPPDADVPVVAPAIINGRG